VTVDFEQYIKTTNLEALFKKLGAGDPETLAGNVTHFTLKEARKRDKIVLGYFGEEGVQRIIEAITERLQISTLRRKSKVLDVGAGSGFFTSRISERTPNAKFYAMDITPAMLKTLAHKKRNITPFLGIAENIEASIKEAQAYFDIPSKFDVVYSTLMLHHSTEPENVFKSIKNVLPKDGKGIILDLCEHNFTEFKTEMEDVHLGFNLDSIRKAAQHYFSNVNIVEIPGIGCSSSGRTADIFIATMRNTK